MTKQWKGWDDFFQKIGNREFKQCLDIACGRGEFIDFLQRNNIKVQKFIGIDFEDRIIDFTQKKYEENQAVDIIKQDAYEIAKMEENFDLITVSNSLHHFEKPKEIIKNIYQKLPENGTLLIHEMINSEDLNNAQQSHVKTHHWTAKIDRIMGRCHNKTYSKDELKKIALSQDFSNKSYYQYTYEVENPKDEELLNRYLMIFDLYLQKVDASEQKTELAKEADEIKNWIKDNGFAPATSVIVMLQK